MSEGRAAVRLEGRLHPASIAIVGLSALRGVGLLLVISVIQIVRLGHESLGAMAFSLACVLGPSSLILIGPVLHWLRYRWRVTDEALEVETGMIGRRVRRVPLSRIQDVDVSQGIVQRLFGVVALSVHTAGTAKAEVELSAITRDEAQRLIAALRRSENGEVASATEVRAEAPPLLEISAGQLVLRGLTDNRAGLVVLSALAIAERFFGDAELVRPVIDAAEPILLRVEAAGPLAWAVGLAIAAIALVPIGYVASVGFNLLTFFGYRLRLEGEVLRREHGLLTRHVRAVPRSRIQALIIHRSPVRRLLGLGSLEAFDMGSGLDAQSQQRTGRDGFVPIATDSALRAVIAAVFPGIARDTTEAHPVSPRMIRRTTTLGLIVGALVASGALALEGPLRALPLVVALASPVLAYGYGRLAHARLRVVLDGPFVHIRRGVLWREEITAPATAIEALTCTRGPLDRFHGVATLRYVVGGGGAFVVHNVALDEARAALARVGAGTRLG